MEQNGGTMRSLPMSAKILAVKHARKLCGADKMMKIIGSWKSDL